MPINKREVDAVAMSADCKASHEVSLLMAKLSAATLIIEPQVHAIAAFGLDAAPIVVVVPHQVSSRPGSGSAR